MEGNSNVYETPSSELAEESLVVKKKKAGVFSILNWVILSISFLMFFSVIYSIFGTQKSGLFGLFSLVFPVSLILATYSTVRILKYGWGKNISLVGTTANFVCSILWAVGLLSVFIGSMAKGAETFMVVLCSLFLLFHYFNLKLIKNSKKQI